MHAKRVSEGERGRAGEIDIYGKQLRNTVKPIQIHKCINVNVATK